ncbi:hypothetical protein [Shewanella marisflavi]|uniref:hypothetical protein n=1 Tax=Shewanella marisflavi TaxID=260364 RepID=UPI003AAB5DAC
MKGLIIRREWLNKIFRQGKSWEMRATDTKHRGETALIEAGTGLIVGQCHITATHKLGQDEARASLQHHQVDDLSLLNKWCWAWHLENIQQYANPISYQHPQGAVIWVNLSESLNLGEA